MLNHKDTKAPREWKCQIWNLKSDLCAFVPWWFC